MRDVGPDGRFTRALAFVDLRRAADRAHVLLGSVAHELFIYFPRRSSIVRRALRTEERVAGLCALLRRFDEGFAVSGLGYVFVPEPRPKLTPDAARSLCERAAEAVSLLWQAWELRERSGLRNQNPLAQRRLGEARRAAEVFALELRSALHRAEEREREAQS